MKNKTSIWDGATVISSYSRSQAIEDGVLVDVTEWASSDKGFRGGFTVPVAVTRSVWEMIEAIPASQSHQDVRGRAHDLLWMASLAARAAKPTRRRIPEPTLFRVIMRAKGDRKSNRVFKMASGPGDNGEHVITIMQTDED